MNPNTVWLSSLLLCTTLASTSMFGNTPPSTPERPKQKKSKFWGGSSTDSSPASSPQKSPVKQISPQKTPTHQAGLRKPSIKRPTPKNLFIDSDSESEADDLVPNSPDALFKEYKDENGARKISISTVLDFFIESPSAAKVPAACNQIKNCIESMPSDKKTEYLKRFHRKMLERDELKDCNLHDATQHPSLHLHHLLTALHQVSPQELPTPGVPLLSKEHLEEARESGYHIYSPSKKIATPLFEASPSKTPKGKVVVGTWQRTQANSPKCSSFFPASYNFEKVTKVAASAFHNRSPLARTSESLLSKSRNGITLEFLLDQNNPTVYPIYRHADTIKYASHQHVFAVNGVPYTKGQLVAYAQSMLANPASFKALRYVDPREDGDLITVDVAPEVARSQGMPHADILRGIYVKVKATEALPSQLTKEQQEHYDVRTSQ